MENIISLSEQKNKKFYEIILEEDCKEREVTEKESFDQMRRMWQSMLESSGSYDKNLQSKSGLVGGNGAKMLSYKESFSGDFMSQVIAEALKMGESNACMKKIVAAPTAGSCGVIPAVLIPCSKINAIEEERIIRALYVSAGIGQVINERAFLSGAAGGCQAEIGSASAMAAGALVSVKDGSNEQICDAVAMSLKNMLGLVCDPIGGLVEVPCVKRNVVGAVNAISSADMALAGIKSQIPADQVIDAMREIGENMNEKYKETAYGGCAATKRGVEVKNNINSY